MNEIHIHNFLQVKILQKILETRVFMNRFRRHDAHNSKYNTHVV